MVKNVAQSIDKDDRVSTSLIEENPSPLHSGQIGDLEASPFPPKLFRVIRRPSALQHITSLNQSVALTNDDSPVKVEERKSALVRFAERIDPKIGVRRESEMPHRLLASIAKMNADKVPREDATKKKALKEKFDNSTIHPYISPTSFRELKSIRPSKDVVSPEASTRLPKTNLTIAWESMTNWTNIYDTFKFARQLGQGTFARVYEAFEKKTGIPFAIKVLDKDRITELRSKHLIEKELQVLSVLNHPNVCRFAAMVEDRKRVYFVLEHCGGNTLAQLLKKYEGRKMSEQEAKKFFLPILKAVAYIHDQGYCHRDIKLTNILVGEDGNNIKLIDFGFADFSNIPHSSYCGTPAYMAPEIVEKRSHYGPPCDVWALGVILFKLLVGEYPFGGKIIINL